jgi:hypothetical protein
MQDSLVRFQTVVDGIEPNYGRISKLRFLALSVKFMGDI